MDRVKYSINNSIWGILYRVLHMAVPVCFRAIIIRDLGVAYVGLNGLFLSMLTVLNLTELGFGAAVVYMMYKPIVENDTETLRNLLALLRTIYRWIGLIMMAMGLAMLPFLHFLIHNDTGVEVNYYALYLMYLFHTVVSYWMFAYKSSLFTAYQRSDVIFKIMFFCGLVEYGLQFIVLFTTHNYYLYILVFMVMIIPQNISYQIVSKKMYPDLYCEGKATEEQVETLKTKIKALIGHRVGNTVIFSIDSIIISIFLGVTILAQYDNYNYVVTAIVTLLTIIQSSVLASVGNKIVVDSTERVYNLFKRLTFIWIGLVGWCSACFATIFQPFITIWVGGQYLFSDTLVLCIVLYFFLWQFRNMGVVFKDAAGLWEADFFKPYIGMALNVILSVICVAYSKSIFGVLLPTMAIMMFLYYPWETHVLFKYLFQRSSREYIIITCKYSIFALIGTGAVYCLCRWVSLGGIIGIVVNGILSTLIMPGIYMLLSIRTPEYKGTLDMIIGFIKNRKQ